MKLHFTKNNYNYFKSHSSASLEAFSKRKDYHFFNKLAKKYSSEQIVDFLVSQFIVDKNFWIGDSFNTKSHDIYMCYIKVKHSLSTVYKKDLEFLYNTYTYNELYIPTKGYPKIISAYLGDLVRLETLVLLDAYIDWTSKIDILECLVWSPLSFKINKFKPFLEYCDMSKIVVISEEVLNSL